MPKIVGKLRIQDTEIFTQGQSFSTGVGSGISIPTAIDGGKVAGITQASVDGDGTFSFDGGVIA